MVKFLIILAMFWSMASISHAGWFCNHEAEQQHIQDLQQRLAQQSHQNSQMQGVIVILASGVVVALVIGTAVGSKARKEVK